MPKTRIDVGTQALRRLGVCGVADDPGADDQAQAVIAMDAALAELVGQHGITVAWDANAVPDDIFLAFSDFVASELALIYRLQGPSRSRSIARLRADLLPDDRGDPRDVDDDGTVSTEEAAAGERAAYY